jgi:hypothetical protein
MQPLSRDGRMTLVYAVFAGAGPATSVINGAAMVASYRAGQWDTFYNLAMTNAVGNGIIVTALAMFVSIRTLQISKDGFKASGGESE